MRLQGSIHFPIGLLLLATAWGLVVPQVQAQGGWQGQWVFPLYFQDALGRRDTLRFLLHDNAKIPFVDTQLGEVHYSVVPNKFQAFIRANVGGVIDTGKVWAYPTGQGGFSQTINLQNFAVPLRIRWDKRLLEKTNLNLVFDRAYLRSTTLCIRPLGEVDMTTEDSLVLYRVGCEALTLNLEGSLKYEIPNDIKAYNFKIFPQPVSPNGIFNLLTTELSGALVSVKFHGSAGIANRYMPYDDEEAPLYKIYIGDMPAGVYIAEVQTTRTRAYLKVLVTVSN